MLKAGYAESIITPPLPVQLTGHRGPRIASSIGDDLKVRAIVINFRDTLVALVSCDLIWLPRRIVLRIRDTVSRTAAVRPENLMVACTHTHSGPDTMDWYSFAPPVPHWWLEWLVNMISSTVYQAAIAVENVDVSYGIANFDLAVNRRSVANGTVYRDPNEAGPVSKNLTTICFKSNDKVIAGIVHAAMHPVVLGSNSLRISADWCGAMLNSLEHRCGGGWLFLNGCAGDNNPRAWTGRSYEEMEVVGHQAADRAEIAIKKEKLVHIDSLWGRTARSVFDSQPHPYLSMEQRRREAEDNCLILEAQVLQLGPLKFIGIGGECLYDAGEAIRKDESDLIVSYANDYFGYLPIGLQYDQGGYEPSASMLSRGGAESYIGFVRDFVLVVETIGLPSGEPRWKLGEFWRFGGRGNRDAVVRRALFASAENFMTNEDHTKVVTTETFTVPDLSYLSKLYVDAMARSDVASAGVAEACAVHFASAEASLAEAVALARFVDDASV